MDDLSRSDRRQPGRDQTAPPARRCFDATLNAYSVPVLPGAWALTGAGNEVLVAVTGGSVAVCARDPERGLGGMCHFLLPGAARRVQIESGHALYFGIAALEKFLADLAARGARRDALEIKLFGGAGILKGRAGRAGEATLFARGYMEAEGLQVVSDDMGGPYPRRINYFPATGRVFRLLMRRSDDAEVFSREVALRDGMRPQKAEAGGMEPGFALVPV